ncbi:HAD family hydrolase [Aestuariivirga litoralis]|uniref:HAD family hydrolase n=1 Tax=Aestuariivirga litoralis TaxID=2650924 RepID=UPI0018C7587F|nr:HAD family hydrolase [Aestuariivirga litoralis]MBG1233333.1 HAD family hydrolase [Aestuariivirga litoralis]
MQARTKTAFIFDLDGTLLDSVYDHVMAWGQALRENNIEVPVWKIHRRIGMSGGLFTAALVRELGRDLPEDVRSRIRDRHAEIYSSVSAKIPTLPGAIELLKYLSANGIQWAIATSGHIKTAGPVLHKLGVDPAKHVVITRDLVRYAKPDPDLFLAAAEKLGVDIKESCIVGDAIWDMLAAKRAHGLGVGLLTGGYGEDELIRAGAYRVFQDPADMLDHIDELGGRR